MDRTDALSPLDGRYRPMVEELAYRLSERALNNARIDVEAEWLIFLSRSGAVPTLRRLGHDDEEQLRSLARSFDREEAAELKAIENSTGHDVKAIEYYIKGKIRETSLGDVLEFVHFCCTSEDINNLSYGRMLKSAVQEVWLPRARALHGQITELALEHRDLPMLSRTHGQAATPTTVGKELAVFSYRLARQLRRIESQEFLGKLNGATGTFSAHVAACPTADWPQLSRDFVESLGLAWNPLTTQIEPHDYMAELFSDIARFNSILTNFDTDVWQYISLGYFRQARTEGSVGSSTMPHKINPIKFENSEANLEVSNALLDGLGRSLVNSRMQRDLSDSSALRNIGVALGHSVIGIENAAAGLSGLDVNPTALDADLAQAWEVLGEAVQSVMRRSGMDQPYERLKELTRGASVSKETLRDFIVKQDFPETDREFLLSLTPHRYTGVAGRLVEFADRPTGL